MHIQLHFVIILYQTLVILRNSTTFCCLKTSHIHIVIAEVPSISFSANVIFIPPG